jgi:DNA-3-methyladenine glycosylase
VPLILAADFFHRPTLDVARDLIGKVLVHRTATGITAGCIVEVEAYIGEDDPACHAAAGPTARNQPLYGPPGHAYVYLNYGLHHLVNAVTEAEGFPAAVLIRALAPVDGLDLMRRRRRRVRRASTGGRRRTAAPRLDNAALCRGPGNLTVAMGIGAALNRHRLWSPPLTIEDHGPWTGGLSWGPRIGISRGADRPWRCWATAHPAVSASRPGPRRR